MIGKLNRDLNRLNCKKKYVVGDCFRIWPRNILWNLPESSREGVLWEWGYGGGGRKTNGQGTIYLHSDTKYPCDLRSAVTGSGENVQNSISFSIVGSLCLKTKRWLTKFFSIMIVWMKLRFIETCWRMVFIEIPSLFIVNVTNGQELWLFPNFPPPVYLLKECTSNQ